jgi:hypothetical protein
MTPALRSVADVVGVQLLHHLQRALDDAADAGLAHEHVVRFLGQHEARGARQRVERALGEALELELAVAVGEVREHEERQPVVHRLVERAQDARLVDVARVALEQFFGFLAAVAAEVRVQQVDHGPQVAALLHVHLEQVAQVVQRRRGVAQQALLLHRRRLGVALRDDQAAEGGAVLAGHVLPDVLAHEVAEADLAVLFLVGQEDAPAVVGHRRVAVAGPARGVDADGGAQVDVVGLEVAGTHLVPPVQERGLPFLQRPLQLAVVGEVDVVGNLALAGRWWSWGVPQFKFGQPAAKDAKRTRRTRKDIQSKLGRCFASFASPSRPSRPVSPC